MRPPSRMTARRTDARTGAQEVTVKRLLSLSLAGVIVLACVAVTGSQRHAPSRATPHVEGKLRIDVAERNPWTHLRLDDAPETFHFAVVCDRTGGARPQVFDRAVAQLNLLRPAFVLSVGDLIEGYTDDDAALTGQWQALEQSVRKLQMPFFFVAGNHDLSNATQERHWRERFGRRHYHFVYRNVLFLLLNCSDPPGSSGTLGRAQLAYARSAPHDNPRVRLSVGATHQPA